MFYRLLFFSLIIFTLASPAIARAKDCSVSSVGFENNEAVGLIDKAMSLVDDNLKDTDLVEVSVSMPRGFILNEDGSPKVSGLDTESRLFSKARLKDFLCAQKQLAVNSMWPSITRSNALQSRLAVHDFLKGKNNSKLGLVGLVDSINNFRDIVSAYSVKRDGETEEQSQIRYRNTLHWGARQNLKRMSDNKSAEGVAGIIQNYSPDPRLILDPITLRLLRPLPNSHNNPLIKDSSQ